MSIFDDVRNVAGQAAGAVMPQLGMLRQLLPQISMGRDSQGSLFDIGYGGNNGFGATYTSDNRGNRDLNIGGSLPIPQNGFPASGAGVSVGMLNGSPYFHASNTFQNPLPTMIHNAANVLPAALPGIGQMMMQGAQAGQQLGNFVNNLPPVQNFENGMHSALQAAGQGTRGPFAATRGALQQSLPQVPAAFAGKSQPQTDYPQGYNEVTAGEQQLGPMAPMNFPGLNASTGGWVGRYYGQGVLPQDQIVPEYQKQAQTAQQYDALAKQYKNDTTQHGKTIYNRATDLADEARYRMEEVDRMQSMYNDYYQKHGQGARDLPGR